MNPKILVCCPTSIQKSYSEAEYFERICNLTYSNYDVFVADNSPTDENAKYLQNAYGINTKWINPKNYSLPKILALSHEACRQHAIGGKYDFIMHIESDVIVPYNVIELLLFHNLPVVGFSYMTGKGTDIFPMVQLEAAYNNKEVFNFHPSHGALKLFDGKMHKVHSIGLGCVLIHKQVFSKIPFRYVQNVDAYPDSFFAHDCREKDFDIHLDTSQFMTHRSINIKG